MSYGGYDEYQTLLSSSVECIPMVVVTLILEYTCLHHSEHLYMIGGCEGEGDVTIYGHTVIRPNIWKFVPSSIPTSTIVTASIEKKQSMYYPLPDRLMNDTARPNFWHCVAKLIRPSFSAGACYMNGYLYVTGGALQRDRGGFSFGSHSERVNISSFDSNTISSMIRSRRDHQLVHYTPPYHPMVPRLFAIGGVALGETLNCMEEYDDITKRWKLCGSHMFVARMKFACTIFNHQIWIFGGRERYNKFCDSVEMFDLALDTWYQIKTTLPLALSSSTSTSATHKLYAFACEARQSIILVGAMIMEYIPSTNIWNIIVSLPLNCGIIHGAWYHQPTQQLIIVDANFTFGIDYESAVSLSLLSVIPQNQWRQLCVSPSVNNFALC